MRETVIHLHQAAPAKPAQGETCNGCGVCCALTTCPVARLRFLQVKGPCPALIWSATELRYRCNFLLRPAHYLSGLPRALEPLASRLFARWISAGSGCDCDATSHV